MKLLDAIQIFDIQTFNWCLDRKHRLIFVQLSRWISRTADGHLYGIGAIVLALSGHWALFKLWGLGFIVERSLYFILKNKLKRNRPQQTIPGYVSVIQPSDKFSFPSGHTSAAFLTMGIISYVFPLATVPFLIWAIWVGISRIILGVHFPTDSLAGALLGYSISQLCLALFI